MSSNIINLTAANIQQDLLDAPQGTVFVIDFWADWCEPCKQLMPVLDKLAAEFEGRMILAKVNCDAEQQLAMQFGIKSLPTVMVFKDGQPIDGFAGVQPESEIRAMLEKHLPKPQDDLYQQAFVLHQQGDMQGAYPLVTQALSYEPDNSAFKLLLADISIELGKVADAKALIETIKMADQDAQYQHVLAKIELAEQAADSPEIRALQDALEAKPDSLEIKRQLALALNQANRHEEALELLLQVLKKDMNFEDVKKVFVDMLNGLPDGDPLASAYRRKLYALMY